MRNPQNPCRAVAVGGVEYPSVSSAAKALGVMCSEVSRAARRGGSIGGKAVRYAAGRPVTPLP